MLKRFSIQLDHDKLFQGLIVLLLFCIYFRSLFTPLVDNDAAHHANIAMRMFLQNDYVSLIDRDHDYLDKPHLVFWAALMSYKVFGINAFAYRLPAFLFALLACFSTYKLTRRLSDITTAKLATVMLATALGFLLSVTDARMEAPLAAFVIFGIWQMTVFVEKRTWGSLILAALGAAGAFATKGWLGPVIIFVSIFFKVLLEKRWSVLASYKIYLLIPLFFLFISPVLYAYYLQFDLHPEKEIRGMTEVSGVRFILWSQNFERFEGENWASGGRNSSYFFFYHTFLWAFFPWCIAAYVAAVYWCQRMIRGKKWRHPFNYLAAAFVFIFVIISFSKFKMPHYLNMLLPLAAIFTAPYLRFVLTYKPGQRFFYSLHFFIAIATALLTIVANFYFFPINNWLVGAVGVALLAWLFYLVFKKNANKGEKAVQLGVVAAVAFSFLLIFNFYPQLMQYQGGYGLADQVEEKKIPAKDILLLEPSAHAFSFRAKHNYDLLQMDTVIANYPTYQGKLFLFSNETIEQLKTKGYEVQPVLQQLDYQVTRLKLKFLNPATRTPLLDSLTLGRIVPRK